MLREIAKMRNGMRMRDISESKHLLWELVTHEPTVLQCFNIVESTCMAQGLFCKIDGEPCGEDFQRFVDRHYIPFCRQAIRSFFTYGFVPWVVRTLDDGDEIPEVLSNGTFHWYTEIPSKEPRAVRQQRDSGFVSYRVQITAPLEVKDHDVNVYVHTPPALDISVNSMLYATVPSPLSHVLIDYKNMRQAQIRRSHADAWNTTAKLICTFKPNVRVQEDPSSSLMDFADDSYYQPGMHFGIPVMPPLAATNLWTRDAQVRRQFESAPGTHQPDVFTLPRDHEVAQQHHLEPCEDLDFLLHKFQHDVCAVTGVPEEMVRSNSRSAQETVKKTMATGRIFSSNMQEICRRLQILLWQVYKRIYGKDNAEFVLLPMPRLEVESIADLKVLSEIGALTPDMSLQMSQIILGEDVDNKRKRIELERGARRGAQAAPGLIPEEIQGLKVGSTKKARQNEDTHVSKPGGRKANEEERPDPKKRPPPPSGPRQ